MKTKYAIALALALAMVPGVASVVYPQTMTAPTSARGAFHGGPGSIHRSRASLTPMLSLMKCADGFGARSIIAGRTLTERGVDKMKPYAIALAAVMAMAPGGASADQPSPYEDAARTDIATMATNVLAASVCKNARFSDDAGVIGHLMAASLILKKDGVRKAYLSATKAAIDQMEAQGLDTWCAAILTAAEARGSQMLTTIKEETK